MVNPIHIETDFELLDKPEHMLDYKDVKFHYFWNTREEFYKFFGLWGW